MVPVAMNGRTETGRKPSVASEKKRDEARRTYELQSRG